MSLPSSLSVSVSCRRLRVPLRGVRGILWSQARYSHFVQLSEERSWDKAAFRSSTIAAQQAALLPPGRLRFVLLECGWAPIHRSV